MENKTQVEANTSKAKQAMSRRFELKFGYQDKEKPEVFHREIVISRRPTGADFIKAVEGDTEVVQYNLDLIASAISVFGSLSMPTPTTSLLSLNEIDRDKLRSEFFLFLLDTQSEQEQKVLEDNRAQLAFGITRGGVKYDVAKFGYLLTGYDEIDIRKESQNEWQFNASKMAREITELSTLDGSKKCSDTLTIAEMEAMDATDFLVLREAESGWLDSFRK